jgi:hypothetical protein
VSDVALLSKPMAAVSLVWQRNQRARWQALFLASLVINLLLLYLLLVR